MSDRKRNPAVEAERVQRNAREQEEALQRVDLTAPATDAFEHERDRPDRRLEDLPDDLRPDLNPTTFEQALPTPVLLGEVSFDATGKQVSGHAILPRRLTAAEWEAREESGSYSTEAIAAQGEIEARRRNIMDAGAETRRQARDVKKRAILERLKTSQSDE